MNAVVPRRLDPLGVPAGPIDRVWYAAYGSNMDPRRLTYYLAGGRHPGGTRTYPGCADRRQPERSCAVLLPGLVYFATESPVWGGGRAFYEPDAEGEAPARAYLLSVAQFSGIAAQEMYESPGREVDLREVIAHGRARLGPGRYETLVCPGFLDGLPVVTFTAPWAVGEVAGRPPSPGYLRHLASGLMEAHGWTAGQAAGYLAGCPGAEGHWTPAEVAAVLRRPVL
ncbi:histone deacetylase [Streptomyces syringium]|uniref:Histone deacetylase n=2 Tax=Streptomyces syringium TaxID=76729 RepID=A0ABS4YDG9_9ACTN|nr:histone deacetylase [Streptomyces syringium]MBP2406844.1 hypothetical protein [Streptomyces syringium]